MGKITKGLVGGFTGKVGNIVGRKDGSKEVIQSLGNAGKGNKGSAYNHNKMVVSLMGNSWEKANETINRCLAIDNLNYLFSWNGILKSTLERRPVWDDRYFTNCVVDPKHNMGTVSWQVKNYSSNRNLYARWDNIQVVQALGLPFELVYLYARSDDALVVQTVKPSPLSQSTAFYKIFPPSGEVVSGVFYFRIPALSYISTVNIISYVQP